VKFATFAGFSGINLNKSILLNLMIIEENIVDFGKLDDKFSHHKLIPFKNCGCQSLEKFLPTPLML
jgi:hypothetical protein